MNVTSKVCVILFVAVAILLVTVVTSVDFTIFASEWSCETVYGDPCLNSMVWNRGNEEIEPYINGSMQVAIQVVCSDASKQKMNTHWRFRSTGSSLKRFTMKTECTDESTPCIKDFVICIQDHNVPAITFKCSYLRNFAETASSGSTNTKCGENGAMRKTYWTNAEFDATKIEYSNEQIHIAKDVTIAKPTNLEICIKNHNVPAITLESSYLRSFDQTALSYSNITKCGENGVKIETLTCLVLLCLFFVFYASFIFFLPRS